MFLAGQDKEKPVLLFLGGGPGIPEYLLETRYRSGLEEDFIVCYLEYRGTCCSYRSDIPPGMLTTERFIQDAAGVTRCLQERFHQEKIYLMGHSFGTYIGLLTAFRYPALYHGYIAMSQITDQERSEKLAYHYMVEQYRKAGNKRMVRRFERYPILKDADAYQAYFHSPLRDQAMHALGIGTMRDMRSVISGIFLPSLLCRSYTLTERVNIWRGKALCAKAPVSEQAGKFNAFRAVPRLHIPIYFLAGFYDYTCSYALQKEYFEQIQAPEKEFYTFEHSAHSPLFEEQARAKQILRHIAAIPRT